MSSLIIRSPATIFDMAEFSGARTVLQWAVIKEMHAGGLSFYVGAGDRAIGLFGVYPMEDGVGEAWFNVRPDAGFAMLKLVRAIRLTLDGLDYREIVTICITQEGARVAQAIGFVPSGSCEIGDIWKWTH